MERESGEEEEEKEEGGGSTKLKVFVLGESFPFLEVSRSSGPSCDDVLLLSSLPLPVVYICSLVVSSAFSIGLSVDVSVCLSTCSCCLSVIVAVVICVEVCGEEEEEEGEEVVSWCRASGPLVVSRLVMTSAAAVIVVCPFTYMES